MNKIIYTCFLCSFMLLLGFSIHEFLPTKKTHELFSTEKPLITTITNEIRARGKLEVTDLLKIGSKIPGTILKMYYQEGAHVKKGDLLADIDDGKSDTEVLQSAAELKRLKALLAYQKSYYTRQQVLYENGYISQDAFEQIERDYKVAQANVEAKQANHQQIVLLFDNKKIIAPENGFILTKNSTESETVTNSSPATILYSLAKNSSMEAQLEIDEPYIGNVTIGTPVTLSFDALPHQIIKGTITSIGNAPIKSGGMVSYTAIVPVDNSEKLFRLGMSTNAHIILASTENAVTVPQYAFAISQSMIKDIAAKLQYSVHTIDDDSKQQNNSLKKVKYLWIYKDHAFYEKAVTIGTQNILSAQITSGIDAQADIVMDVIQQNLNSRY